MLVGEFPTGQWKENLPVLQFERVPLELNLNH